MRERRKWNQGHRDSGYVRFSELRLWGGGSILHGFPWESCKDLRPERDAVFFR